MGVALENGYYALELAAGLARTVAELEFELEVDTGAYCLNILFGVGCFDRSYYPASSWMARWVSEAR